MKSSQFLQFLNSLDKAKTTNKKNKKSKKSNNYKNLLNSIPYEEKTKLQTTGIGKKILRVEGTFGNTGSSNINSANVIQLAVSSDEFNSYKLEYAYFRIVGVKVTILPQNSIAGTNTATPSLQYNYIKMVWNGFPLVTATSIVTDDNAKRFGSYRIKPLHFKFKPPDVQIASTAGFLNLREKMATTLNSSYLNEPALYWLNSGSIAGIWMVIIELSGTMTTAAATKIESLFSQLEIEEGENILKKLKQIINKKKFDEINKIQKNDEEDSKEEEI